MKQSSYDISGLPAPCLAGYLQFDVIVGGFDENLAQVRDGMAAFAPSGPGIVVLPELWATGFAYKRLPELAGRTPEALDALKELALKYQTSDGGIYFAGSLPEEVRTGKGSCYYNTLYITGPDGICGSYRKQHLFAPMFEDRYFEPGDNPMPISTPLGLMAGLVCFDLRFSGLAGNQAALGAGLLVVSAQWPAVRRDHWQTLIRARAIENQIFVAACNRCGSTEGVEFGGYSMIVSPDGTVLAQAGDATEYGGVQLEPMLLEITRSSFNSVAPDPRPFHDSDKIMELEKLKTRMAVYKKLGRKVVFTNGCFDLMHVGHVTYLETARRQGDCLVVGLNSDRSIRSIKGPDRPVNRLEDRARILAALGCVDHVVVFDEDTPLNLIKVLMPDVLVKGADWSVEEIVGAKEVVAAGGRVAGIPLVEAYSSTSLIKRIRYSRNSSD
ncbi:MAG: D-glycero-beta-D-manno-heptose 1-phosphate adenylyltransferase [Desulfobulbaceae bacterium]|nr:D-glycero-beta-D-manno-heptose 1-phosphate adenylyltransferase [Desulfobulbaceae bacterium]